MHLNLIFFKDDFLKTVEAKVIIITRYVQSNETVTINKFQRSRLTFVIQPYCSVSKLKKIKTKFQRCTGYLNSIKTYKARLIANSSSCTTTELSKLLTSCLTAVKKHVIKYCNKSI